MKEFEALIEKYESITIDDIKKVSAKTGSFSGADTANGLTGYGAKFSCTLCVAVDGFCNDCTWNTLTGDKCGVKDTGRTYIHIFDAETPKELLQAFKNRAAYMRKVLNIKVAEFENEWNVSVVSKTIDDKKVHHVHGHSSTEAETKLEVIKNYLKE